MIEDLLGVTWASGRRDGGREPRGAQSVRARSFDRRAPRRRSRSSPVRDEAPTSAGDRQGGPGLRAGDGRLLP